MATFRTDPLTGKTLISKDNKVQKDGFTNRERAGEYGTRSPQQPKKTTEKEGDAKEAIRFMRAAGLHGLADMYETNGNAAKEGKIPPLFANNKFFAGVKIIPEGQSADTKATATVGDTGGPTAQDFINAAPEAMNYKATQTNHVAEQLEKSKYDPEKLPMPNILHDFASFNNLFSFGCLSAEELNFPDSTYRKNGIKDGHYVLRSAGGLNAKQKPRTGAEQQYNIDTEYYIDSVNIEESIAPNRKSRHTNFHSLDFTVREPYSMGQFLETLYRAARNAGYNNYLEAPWLLQINFVGHQDVERSRPAIAASKKQLCVKLVNVVFDVDTEGSFYTITTAPYNESIFSDQIQGLPVDITVSGNTLEEICQTGVNSVATHINTHLLKDQATKDIKIEKDEYIICFPTDTSSKKLQSRLHPFDKESAALTGDYMVRDGINYARASAFLAADEGLQEARNFSYMSRDKNLTGEKVVKDYIDGILGFSIKRGDLSESIKQAVSSDQNGVNAIGKQRIDPGEPLRGGNSPFAGGKFVLNAETTNFDRGPTTIVPKDRTIQFRKGTKIQRVIEELVLLSSFGQQLSAQALNDNTGQINWFRIESSCYIVHDQATEAVTGGMPKIFVYKVVPYKVNSSFFQMPNEIPPGYKQLTEQAPKAYNYMYTGKNNDIMEFQIKFDNAFYKALAFDMGNRSASNDPSNKSTTKPGTVAAQNVAFHQPDDFGEISSVAKNIDSGDAITAGAINETAEAKLARRFNEALVKSDVDLVTLNLKILGDPFYISDSGVGNYRSEGSTFTNVKEDGTIDHQSGQVDILLNFQTPIDINDATGGYKMNGPSVGVSNFNGLYFVNIVRSRFEGNIFTQELELVKRPNWKKKDLSGTRAEALLKIKQKYNKRLKQIENDYGIGSDEYNFALADINVSGKLDQDEIRKAGYSIEDAVRIQKAWKNKKPPPEKTPVQKTFTGEGGGQGSGQYLRTGQNSSTGPTASYDDAILRQARANSTYSSDTVNNATTAKIAQGADQSVKTIDNPMADLSGNWTPPSQRGIS